MDNEAVLPSCHWGHVRRLEKLSPVVLFQLNLFMLIQSYSIRGLLSAAPDDLRFTRTRKPSPTPVGVFLADASGYSFAGR